MANSNRYYFSVFFFALAFLIVLALLPALFSKDMRAIYVSESGPIQVLSAAGYLTVVLILLRELGMRGLLRQSYLAILPLAMCARELDFHVMFTTMSMTKTSFYVSPEVPIIEKIAACLVIAVLVWSVVGLLRDAPSLLAALRAGKAHAIALCAAILLVPASEALDGIGRRLVSVGIALGERAMAAAESLEEVIELGIPLFMLVAVFATFPRRHVRNLHESRP